jgi:hypothetical protein
MRLLLEMVLAILLAGSAASAAPLPQDTCAKASVVTVRGTIRGIDAMRSHVEAGVRVYLDVELASPLCGQPRITVSMTGGVPCAVGETIEVTGDYTPPSRFTGATSLRGHGIPRCSTPK